VAVVFFKRMLEALIKAYAWKSSKAFLGSARLLFG